MTVVQEPENPQNKCLGICYDGTDMAYDFAPVLGVDIVTVTSKSNPTISHSIELTIKKLQLAEE